MSSGEAITIFQIYNLSWAQGINWIYIDHVRGLTGIIQSQIKQRFQSHYLKYTQIHCSMSLHLNAIFSFYLRLILNIHYSLIVFVRAWADKNNIPVSKYILTIGSICIFSMFCRWRILKLLDRRLARLQQRYNLKLKNWIHSYVSTQPTLQTLQALQSSSELLRQIILASSWNWAHSLSNLTELHASS